MNVITLAEDGRAQKFVKALLNPDKKPSRSGKVLIWSLSTGGPKTVAVYSLPDKEMFLDSGQGRTATPDSPRAAISIFVASSMDPKRDAQKFWELSTKAWNKANRRRLTPEILQSADIFVAINRETDIKSFDLYSIKSELASMSKVSLPQGMQERAGYVAYTALPQERVVYPGEVKVNGAKYVWYGTSGATNIAELLLTMAAAYKLGLPARFDNYGNSVKETLEGQKMMGKFAKALSGVVGVKFNLTLMSTATDILEKMRESANVMAREIERTLGHSVGLGFYPGTGQVSTNSYSWLNSHGHKNASELHTERFRFGGAPIYWAFYAQAQAKKFVAILYDGSKGGVHKLARPWMKDPYGLWICPAGSFSICSTNAKSPYEVVDPTIFLHALERSNRKKQVLTRLWELALERVPLKPEKVGTGVVVKVNDNGSIEVIS
ncbi:MAG: hypothetical protein UU72_C0001G0101 [candidate division WWE3 bacterium GW2011_GWB1_41_6]|uniref:Uncharacterized protein n=3 Tax=Katanobacteria TaxID=422282 RepID=A0A0G0WZN4_UNCKA|nr:MAG: hypothetical protein UU72_C0001G0101 [candidate division WWE3 bacterium GW2011_GWB1_41_6]